MERLTEKCHCCDKKCPQEELACEMAKGRMYATNEVIRLQKELEAYKQAEEDGLLIRLPCKVGEIIYEIQEDRLSSTIETIEFEGREYHRHIPKYFISMNMFSLSKMEKIGKTVFLTKAEAEQALAKMKGV